MAPKTRQTPRTSHIAALAARCSVDDRASRGNAVLAHRKFGKPASTAPFVGAML
jgi:hypothetical protein